MHNKKRFKRIDARVRGGGIIVRIGRPDSIQPAVRHWWLLWRKCCTLVSSVKKVLLLPADEQWDWWECARHFLFLCTVTVTYVRDWSKHQRWEKGQMNYFAYNLISSFHAVNIEAWHEQWALLFLIEKVLRNKRITSSHHWYRQFPISTCWIDAKFL